MAGKPGSGGPVPKRDDQRRRNMPPAGGLATKAEGAAVVEVPDGDENWHPIALRWYRSLATSGQSAFYEDSDWMTAYAVAESMSREFKPQPFPVGKGEVEMMELPPKAASLAAWLKGISGLMATEGDRRRARLELQRPKSAEEPADVSELAEYRRRAESS